MRRRRKPYNSEDIPSKANRVLNLILIGIILIILRTWHLAVIQHEERVEESRKPQKRVIIEPAKRGTIRDRFNDPLAINKVKYNAAVLYSQIRHIPSIAWEKEGGKKTKKYKRRDYISALAGLLASELHLDRERLEDLIHSKASLYNNLPYVIKEDLTEREYYRLKMLEKDWMGIHTQCLPNRHYPLGKVGGDIIGYMGAISRDEYEAMIQEIKTLETFFTARENGEEPELPRGLESAGKAEERLHNLVERAYTINDYIGKTGIEGKFEESLRGYHGKKSFYSDAKGNFLRELPESRKPQSGDRYLLSISAELQQYAEKLLIQNEKVRVPRVTDIDQTGKKSMGKKHPWIKGGSVVAMDPFTGEILALASYPRFDPNDFIASGNPEISQTKNGNIRRWFETESYIAEIWDQKRPLERESFDTNQEKIVEEHAMMTWERWLEFIFPEESPVKEGLERIKTIKNAVRLQDAADKLNGLIDEASLYACFNLLYPAPQHQPYGSRLPAVRQERLEDILVENREAILEVKKEFDQFLLKIPSNYDKVLLIDICRLVVDNKHFSLAPIPSLEQVRLPDYRQYNAAWALLEETAKEMTKDLFRSIFFKPWREKNQKAYLKQKREEEKEAGIRYAKPYIDLLDKKEEEFFKDFWDENRWHILAAFLTGEKVDDTPYIEHYLAWEKELAQGAHQALPWYQAYWTLKKAVEGLSLEQTVSLLQSFRKFHELNRPLYGTYRFLRKDHGQQLEKHLAAAFYPVYGYGYGRSHAYRQATTQGSIFKIITAYEALVQKYREKKEGPKNLSTLNPLVIVDDTRKKGKTTFVGHDAQGNPIPQLYKGGRIPRSHRSGIGKVDLIKAFEVSSNPYFSLLAVDHMESPNDLARAARDFCYGARTGIDLPAELSGRVPTDLDCNRNGLYAMSIGQHSLVVTPLQTAVMLAAIANGGNIVKPKIVTMAIGNENEGERVHTFPTVTRGKIFLPNEVRDILIEGMYRVSKRTHSAAWGSLSELYSDYPEAVSDLIDMKHQLLGKSSTSESVENIDLDLKLGTNIYNHTWFGGIVYNPKAKSPETFLIHDQNGVPELIVVVYLRYGAWGKDTVPLAAQIAQKWREIKRNIKKM